MDVRLGQWNIITVGNSWAGKTSIMYRYWKDEFVNVKDKTEIFDIDGLWMTKRDRLKNGFKVKIYLKDTLGVERLYPL